VLSASGAHEYLEATAMPVGLMGGLSFAVAGRQLAPGDKIVVYSDGLTEAESSEGKDFGRKRLREIAVAGRGLSCLELHNSLAQAVKNFTGNSPQADDVTLLVLEYRPE
jgi:sigma-B regulation protein RsbU (phosphoserine phosphatase)